MHAPRKRFGQHFLTDQGVISRIVAAIAPKSGQHLVEIGPGQGALTIPILQLTKHLEAVELDRDLIPALERRNREGNELVIHESDVLEFDFADIKQDDRPLRVFGNLPYNISTPLLFHLIDYAEIISDMTFMVQREVARRLAAKPGSEDYGRLSVMIQYHCDVDLLFDVSPGAFFPPPQVVSSIVKLVPYKQYPFVAEDYALFAAIVKQAFGHRRKTLRNSLKEWVNDDVWASCQIRSDLRPENLSVEDFVKLANQMSKEA